MTERWPVGAVLRWKEPRDATERAEAYEVVDVDGTMIRCRSVFGGELVYRLRADELVRECQGCGGVQESGHECPDDGRNEPRDYFAGQPDMLKGTI